MASAHDVHPANPPPPPPPATHQRPKSSFLKSFVHRRQPSASNPASPSIPSEGHHRHHQHHADGLAPEDDAMGVGRFARNNPGALGELQHNQQESAPRSANHEQRDGPRGRSRSPTKTGGRGTFKMAGKSREPPSSSPSKPKKTKSGTNLAGLLSRPKSLKGLYKMAAEEEDKEARMAKDKENRTPDDGGLGLEPPPPIFAQFTSDASARQQRDGRASADVARSASGQASSAGNAARPGVKGRPWSYQVPPSPHQAPPSPAWARHDGSRKGSAGQPKSPNPFSPHHGRSKSATSSPMVAAAAPAGEQQQQQPMVLDRKDIDRHLEAMLDRRNIPENQRYKMRNLNDTIKMEFIRQDWAEMHAASSASAAGRPGTADSAVASASEGDDDARDKPRRTRGKSFTFSRGRSKDRGGNNNTSPGKKSKGEGTLGRHFRSRSTESIISNGGGGGGGGGDQQRRPSSSSGSGSATGGLLAKIKLQQGPADYVAYLRKVQKPELVEVGKLHKLRLLLRNETVAWIEEFIQQGGMTEIVGLLKRIMEVEWREEHEDALLHENLLCLKALSTTARAMQYLHTIQADLFPKLLHMLFDPERRGPSEFTTRNIITSVLFTYIESAPPEERVGRARSVRAHLRDPQPDDSEKPIPFVLEMRQDRPYRVWNKEVVSVTKEVFWIFLHNLNVVALPSEKDNKAASSSPSAEDQGPHAYMLRHFPRERPPVPAAPYVGGVEWDATNYIASHLDLMNAILACTPTAAERNALRAELRISGWDRCLGSSLRLCKEKFYGSVHDGLRQWVAAAAEDGWDVRDVRYGPPPESQSPPKKAAGGAGHKKKPEAPPKIDMPKLDFGPEKQPPKERDAWLS